MLTGRGSCYSKYYQSSTHPGSVPRTIPGLLRVSVPFPVLINGVLPKYFSTVRITLHNIHREIIKGKKNLTVGCDNIPSIHLLHCAATLAEPPQILWQKSYDTSCIPSSHKHVFITAIFKKILIYLST